MLHVSTHDVTQDGFQISRHTGMFVAVKQR